MNNVVRNARLWIAGTVVAAIGVLLVRIVAPHAPGRIQLLLALGGQFVAVVGLFIICVGVSRRVRRDETRATEAASR